MSVDRRDVLAGLACAGALGAAEWLRPRQTVVLMPPGGKLTNLVPGQLGAWVQGGGGDIVVPRSEGSLASRLYGDQLARLYVSAAQGALTMMLSIAYGDQQSDTLQLHRPEACYPALGFTVEPSRPLDIPAPGRSIPAVALTAHARGRIEDVIYWSRLGSRFPRSEAEQRRMRFANALDGIVPDGVLVRASAVRTDATIPVFQEVEGFLRDLTQALGPDGRRVLLARA